MSAKQVVKLSDDERRECHELVCSGTGRARSLMHAQVLLKADASPEGPGWTDGAIAEAFGVSTVTVATLRKTFLREGLAAALRHYRTGGREYWHKIDGRTEAHLIHLICSAPPEGYKCWSLRLLSRRLVELGYVDDISYDTVRLALKKTNCSLGAPCAGASPGNRAPSS
jgi:Homeodomain-like domain